MTAMNDMELNLVSGGEEKTIADILEEFDFDETKDPFYFPDHQLPWDLNRLRPKDLGNFFDTAKHNMELNDMELNLVNGGEGGLISDEIEKILEELDKHCWPAPVIPVPVDPEFDPKNGPLHVMVYPGMEK